MTAGIIIGIIALTALIAFLTLYGIKLCKENDGNGMIYLFFGLNILGLVIGWAILYNARNGRYKKQVKNKKELTDIELKEEIKSS